MEVSETQAAALRAQLAGDVEEHKRLFRQMDRSDGHAYSTLITAAFFEAIVRRFGTDLSNVNIIEFVGDVRARTEDARIKLEPRATERIIRAATSDEDIEDIDAKIVLRTQLFILAALVADEDFDSDGLDEFLTKARNLANQMVDAGDQ